MKISPDIKDILVSLLSIGDHVYSVTKFEYADSCVITKVNKYSVEITNSLNKRYEISKQDLFSISELDIKSSTLLLLIKLSNPNTLCFYLQN